jgi:hypothetical protein
MNKVVCLVAILFISCLSGFAQGAKKNYPKWEVFGGYSREIASNDTCALYVAANGAAPAYCAARVSDYIQSDADVYKSRMAMNGVEASVIRNFTSYFGLKGDFSAHFKNELVTAQQAGGTTQFLLEARLYQFMVGPEVKIRDKKLVAPFAYALIGRAHSAVRITGQTFPNDKFGSYDFTRDGVASALGGGLDLRVSDRASLRSSVDYNPMRVDAAFMSGPGQTQTAFRTSIGVLFR